MKIILVNGVRAREEFNLIAPHLRIGRELDNDISLLSGGLSRYHAKIFQKDGKWFLEDLGSTNGTFLNKEPVRAPMEIHDGDVISLSEQIVEVKRTDDDPIEMVQTQTPAPPLFQLNLTQDTHTPPSITPAFSSKPEIHLTPVATPAASTQPPPPAVESPVINLQGLDTSALFGGSEQTLILDETGKMVKEQTPRKKSNILFNIFIYSVAMIGLLVVILVIITLDQGNKTREGQALLATKNQTDAGVPLTLHFERQKEVNGNLFRFEFRIDFGYKTRLKIFEVNSNVRYDTKFRDLRLKAEVNSEEIDGVTLHQLELMDLEKAIRESGIFQCTENPLATKGNDYFYINVCLGKASNELFEYSNAPPRSIEQIEEAVSKFSLAVLKVGFTRPFEELLEECKMMYEDAKDKYNNAEGDDRHLIEASKRLKYIINALEVFDKKPQLYLDAEKMQKVVLLRRDKKVNDLQGAVQKSYNMNDFSKAREYNIKILSLLDKNDEEDRAEYEKTQRNLIQIERAMTNDLRGIK